MKYEFTAKDLPANLSLLSQNNRVNSVLVNGEKIQICAKIKGVAFMTDYEMLAIMLMIIGLVRISDKRK